MKNTVSLKSLAAELSISVSTVSKALNDSEEISQQTKERVRRLAELRSYTPNPIALRLRQQKTMQIGVILPNIENPFFASVLKGIDQVVNNSDFNMMTFFSNEDLNKEKEYLDFLSKGSVDGILLCMAEETNKKKTYEHILEVSEKGIPLVLFDRIPSQSLGLHSIKVNDVESVQNAFDHLAQRNCKKIAFVSNIPTLIVGKLREEGYMSKVENPLLIVSDEVADLEQQLIKAIGENKIDGIIAADIIATLVCKSTVQRQDHSFKKDISLIGYVSETHNALETPKITYINQHPKKIGITSANILLKEMLSKTKRTKPEELILPTQIVQGETS